ncbi:MAG: aminotransferase class V-fold PLP-dependent enzyme, partial [Verrucomicrobiaceae bacterium]
MRHSLGLGCVHVDSSAEPTVSNSESVGAKDWISSPEPRLVGDLPIYLDGHSTTPLAPEASAAMGPWWHERAGNPNSPHRHGQFADAAVETARGQVASLIAASPGEIHFTSGATEANNLAIIGTALAARARGDER